MIKFTDNQSDSVNFWYCVKTKPKQERIAARSLLIIPDVDVFCPYIRYKKHTSRGSVWFNEAMFPGYLFAKFNLERDFRRVSTTFGVQQIVRFGDTFPVIDEQLLVVLRNELDENDLKTVVPVLSVGDVAAVVEGPFAGLSVVVTRLMPARERVGVLMDFLGRAVELDVKIESLSTR